MDTHDEATNDSKNEVTSENEGTSSDEEGTASENEGTSSETEATTSDHIKKKMMIFTDYQENNIQKK